MKAEDIVLRSLLKISINMKIPESKLFDITDEYELSNLQYSKICEILTLQGYDIVPDEEIEIVETDHTKTNPETDENKISNPFEVVISEFNKLELHDKYRCLVKLAVNIAEEDEKAQKQISDNFMQNIINMNLQYTYIAVLFKAFFESCNNFGKARLSDLIDYFDKFYNDRLRHGLISEKIDSVLSKPGFNKSDIRRIILFNPLKRSFVSKYLVYDKSENIVYINTYLWESLSNYDKTKVLNICDKKLEQYYQKLSK